MANRHEVEVRGMSGLIANIFKKRDGFHDAIAQITERDMKQTVNLTKSFVHVVTGRMRRSVKGKLSPQRLAFKVFYDRTVFENDGVAYYAPYEELGTRLRPAHPALEPAFQIMKEIYSQDVSEAMRRETRG